MKKIYFLLLIILILSLSSGYCNSADLEFVESTEYVEGNYWYIDGVVRNNGSKTLRYVQITVKIYDEYNVHLLNYPADNVAFL